MLGCKVIFFQEKKKWRIRGKKRLEAPLLTGGNQVSQSAIEKTLYVCPDLKPLRILQLNNRIPWPLNDGGNIATWHVTYYLHTFGHDITFAALNTSKHHQKPQVLADIARVVATDIDTKVTPWGAFWGLFGKLPYNLKRFESLEFRSQLARVLQTQEFDVILVETSYMALYLDTLRAYSQAPVILRSHNVEHQIWERLASGESNFLKRRYFRHLAKKIERFERSTAPLFDGIIAITEQDLAWYQRVAPQTKQVCINAGVDTEKFASLPAQHPLQLCFLGSLEWQPNVQGLLWFLENAWPMIREVWPEAEIHVAGKNPPQSLQSLKIPGMVFHGQVPDVHEFLAKYGILVVPLLSGGGMRLKVVEALAAGKCVLSTSLGAEGIRFTEEKDLLIADTPEAFRDQLIQLRDHPGRIEEIRNAAIQLARAHYDWAELVRQFEVFFQEMVN